jgi:DNA-directed RNA polymerase
VIFDTHSKETKDWLFVSQKELEIESIDRGVSRYRELVARKKQGEKPGDLKLMSRWMPYLIKAIELEQQQIEDRLLSGQIRSNDSHELMMLSMDPDKLAYITLVSLFHVAQKPNDCPVLTAALYVSSNVKLQKYLDTMRKQDRDVLTMLMSKRKRIDKASIQMCKRKMGIANIEWPKRRRIELGAALIGLAVECTDMFDIVYVKSTERGNGGRTSGFGYKTTKHIVLKPKTRQMMEKYHLDMETMNPYGLPMVVPPNPWTAEGSGGYLCLKNTVVKGTFEQMITKPSPQLMEALNICQNTEWRINKRVADVMQAVWEAGGDKAGIPGRELKKIPPKPKGFNPKAKRKKRWESVAKEDKDRWLADAEAIHDWNNKTIGLRYQMLFKLDIARRFAKYPAIYFPYQVDWRGRAYPIPAFVHPQADDSGRALLEFAQPIALGHWGFYWLAVHVANLLGADKDSLEGRLRVVKDLCACDQLQRWARDPLTHKEWMDYEDPFKLLAAVMEFVECITVHGVPGDWSRAGLESYAKTFQSRTPVAMDGSCNGLQHYSAIGLDPVGGRATNLVHGHKPQDIYSMVADVVNATIEQDCKLTEDQTMPCWAWRGHVSRKTVKRAVMTTPYGVTKQGILRQFIQDRHTDGLQGMAYKNANYLKQVVYDAVSQVVVAARQYMDWLQNVAKILGEHGLPVEWQTPAGFVVSQAYTSKNRRQVYTAVGNIDYKVSDEDPDIVITKQVRGVAPNVVHSLDASHLFLTILALQKKGISNFGPVHDSYAVHAGFVATMNYEIRHQFVQMHKQSVLETMKTYLENKYGIALPSLPPRGSLDLYEVYQSEYFFH